MKTKIIWRWTLLVLTLVFGLALLVLDSHLQQILRNNLFDQFQRWQPRTHTETPVRIVDIDEESLRRYGQWPWPRTLLAELLTKIGAGGAAQVGFDILFAEPDRTSPRSVARQWSIDDDLRAVLKSLPDHDSVFARVLSQVPSVLGFMAALNASPPPPVRTRFVYVGEAADRVVHDVPGAVTVLPMFADAAAGLGTVSFVPDGDGVIRRVPLLMKVGGTLVPSLTSEILRLAQQTDKIVLHGGSETIGLEAVRIGSHFIPTTPTGEMWLHYSLPVADRYIPAWRVLADPSVRKQLAGKIVLVGSSARGLFDLRFSPFGPVPGIEVHAQVLEQILSGYFLSRPSWALGAEILVLLIGGLGIGYSALRWSALPAASACIAVVVLLFGAAWHAFRVHHLLFDVVSPSIGMLVTFSVCSLARHVSIESNRRWVKSAFTRYVSPNLVDYLVRHPEAMHLGGQRRECSFIFTDLEGFTSLIERIEPEKAVALVNAYLDEMIAIVFRHEGTLNRIVGDALVVMFSAPVPQHDHQQRAMACAIELDAFAARYAAEQQSKGIAFGKTRIGVHAGLVTVGNFGGTHMFEYRALGDPINTAARLESANKYLGTRICVSAAVLDGSPGVRARPIGQLVLKGKTQPLEVFEPLVADLEAGYAPLDEYQAAFEAMQNGRPEALALFENLHQNHPHDPLVALHHQRLAAGEQGDLIVMHDK